MTYSQPAPTRARITRSAILLAAFLLCGVRVVMGTPPFDTLRRQPQPTDDRVPAVIGVASDQPRPPARRQQESRDRRGRPDSAPSLDEPGPARGGTVFDDESPTVTNLDPALLAALRQAARDAASEGVDLYVSSGWRSIEHQERLLRKAISEYGSEEEAARWVASAETSAHVSGDAVDIGPSTATAWLAQHGASYGLCQIYRNEPWHYELRPHAVGTGCPAMYADPTHDPRMQQ